MRELRALEVHGPGAVDLQTVMYEPDYWRLMPRVTPADRWEVVIHLELQSTARLIEVASVRPQRSNREPTS